MIQEAIEVLEDDWTSSHDWDTPGALYMVKGTYDDPYLVFKFILEEHPAHQLAVMYDKGDRIKSDEIGICFLMEAYQMKSYQELRTSPDYEEIRQAVLSQCPETDEDLDVYFQKIWDENLRRGTFRPSFAPDELRREIRSLTCVLKDGSTWEYRRYRDTNATEWLCKGDDSADMEGRVVEAMREYVK